MVTVPLSETWTMGEQIGGGGFGRVYAAHTDSQEPAVIKLIPKMPGADRELLFADLENVRNIVPILDRGEYGNQWALVMPRAEKSLRQLIDETTGGVVGVDTAVPILIDVATALSDLSEHVIHRDLKPENILLLNGHWCLADFGISRYAEATTAPDTQKFALSPPYAAPERWRAERATHATDIYSLGIVAYEMLAGSRPFNGPELHDYRHQHLHEQPEPIAGVSSLLDALIEECLYKSAGARPTAQNVLARLPRITASTSSLGVGLLHKANRIQVSAHAENEQRKSAEVTEAERRHELVIAAQRSFDKISDHLKQTIVQNAPAALVLPNRNTSWGIQLNDAKILMSEVAVTAAEPWGEWDPPAFDVIAHAALRIAIPANSSQYEGRSHSLWYCDAQDAGKYDWYETAFMVSALARYRSSINPFALSPGVEAAKALWSGMAEYQVAWPYTAISFGSALDEFVDRWVTWFAEASLGKMQHPSTMPEKPPTGSWRKK